MKRAKLPPDATCDIPVLDAQNRARICGAPATTTRTVEGFSFNACALCAASLDATGKGRTLAVVGGEPDAGHCGGPECFRDDGAPVDVCTCPCAACVEARERLLREQGDDEHGDPCGCGCAGPCV